MDRFRHRASIKCIKGSYEEQLITSKDVRSSDIPFVPVYDVLELDNVREGAKIRSYLVDV